MDEFKIETERLFRVAEAIGRGDGDLSECLAPDLKHLSEILARLYVLQDLAPGFLDEMFASWIPLFVKESNRLFLAELAQKNANASGFGSEWAAAVAAGRSPKQKDYTANLAELYAKANGVNQSQAIKALAVHTGREEDSIRKVVTRTKKRKK